MGNGVDIGMGDGGGGMEVNMGIGDGEGEQGIRRKVSLLPFPVQSHLELEGNGEWGMGNGGRYEDGRWGRGNKG